MDEFIIHHKILSICEDLMSARRKIEKLNPAEMDYDISILERLLADMENNKHSSQKINQGG